MTQPQGHSTSGSHERYKSPERLEWEQEFDPIRKMREWIIESAIASDSELSLIENNSKEVVRKSKKDAWTAYLDPIKTEVQEVCNLMNPFLREVP